MSALAPFGPMTMRVGPRFYPVASLAEASRMFCAARDKAGTGASETPIPLLIAGGEVVAHVSETALFRSKQQRRLSSLFAA